MKTISEVLAENLGVEDFVDDSGTRWTRGYLNNQNNVAFSLFCSACIPGLRPKPQTREIMQEGFLPHFSGDISYFALTKYRTHVNDIPAKLTYTIREFWLCRDSRQTPYSQILTSRPDFGLFLDVVHVREVLDEV